MFRVFYRPFPTSLNACSGAHIVLVAIEKKVPKILVQGLATGPSRQEQSDWFESAADFLNVLELDEDIAAMLESIQDHWKESVSKRAQLTRKAPFFGADFGRRDFSQPGQGGSGFDGVW